MSEATEMPWWKVTGAAMAVTSIPVVTGGHLYYIEFSNALGERARLLARGLYWLGFDFRIMAPAPLHVGIWERTVPPGEPVIDFEALGKLLDDSNP